MSMHETKPKNSVGGRTQWVEYEICEAVAAIDRENEQAWIECHDPVEVER